MKRTARLRKHITGQWQYQIEFDGRVAAPWQFGPWDKDGAIAQARDRYGRDLEIIVDDETATH